jgi:ketosteroid isomerase-like protein
MNTNQDIPSTIIAMECAALDRWIRGDPSGFLEITAPDVVYFDPYREERVDSLEALTALYKGLWGQVLLDRYELLNPRVQVIGDAAVLTFNYVSYKGENESRWNCTEVYRRDGDRWQIIQTHWSYTQKV